MSNDTLNYQGNMNWNTTTESQPAVALKQIQTESVPVNNEKYNYQNKLSTVGMRIRQKIDQGYYNHSNASLQNDGLIRDYASMIVPQFNTKVILNRQPPMLVNQRTVSTQSDLDTMFHNNNMKPGNQDINMDAEDEYNRKRKI
ncbi:Dif1p NDAI_0J02690 [Naumovozyma dairenensis CBS 421]|uniref:Damage-regulated import facilitator 1 n=1 Tax=Naumovozyma dairenensis (strain ATCC 10597 / BCRC 20456 / CBS 421 / NBRC 0211 / NRRL Y-12639) TaxID=1071378 RepID=G0WH83_NAUDC|nr:hypothetical protein NDAI_0J02690 [Naumovozyma dairenensis CBS 421]CCD27161.1 hypothetical protein NDAI_0J02690 [Naumovozyma dairenensis CBS 421]